MYTRGVLQLWRPGQPRCAWHEVKVCPIHAASCVCGGRANRSAWHAAAHPCGIPRRHASAYHGTAHLRNIPRRSTSQAAGTHPRSTRHGPSPGPTVSHAVPRGGPSDGRTSACVAPCDDPSARGVPRLWRPGPLQRVARGGPSAQLPAATHLTVRLRLARHTRVDPSARSTRPRPIRAWWRPETET